MVEALRAELPVTAIYVAEGAERDGRLKEVFGIAADKGLSLLEVPRVELDRLTRGAVHQGLAARVPAYEYADPMEFLDAAAANHEQPLVVALDSVTDPRNLGAVVRSAAGFGAHGVVIPERRAAGMTASAWKTSAGAAARVPVAQVVNLTRQLRAYQEAGCMVIGLAADGEVTLPALDLARDPWSWWSARRARASRAWSPRPATSSSRSRWRARWSRSTPVSQRASRSTRSPRSGPGSWRRSSPAAERTRPRTTPGRLLEVATGVLVWLLVALPATVWCFTTPASRRSWPATTPSCGPPSTAGCTSTSGPTCPT